MRVGQGLAGYRHTVPVAPAGGAVTAATAGVRCAGCSAADVHAAV